MVAKLYLNGEKARTKKEQKEGEENRQDDEAESEIKNIGQIGLSGQSVFKEFARKADDEVNRHDQNETKERIREIMTEKSEDQTGSNRKEKRDE